MRKSSVFRAISFLCSIFEGGVLLLFEKRLKTFKTAENRRFFAFAVLNTLFLTQVDVLRKQAIKGMRTCELFCGEMRTSSYPSFSAL